MEYVRLGSSGLVVSRLCFGGLTIGPLQANLPEYDGALVIAEAIQRGVSFIDTAELYGTYAHIREACRMTGKDPVISTKSYAYDRKQAEKSLEKARKELDRDVIDLFMLHEQESRLTLEGHAPALEYYVEAVHKGYIKAVGVSTHNIEVVKACTDMPQIDVVHPIVNRTGLGIGDGTIDDMLEAVRACYSKGKGIFAMKPLGGGNFHRDAAASLRFVTEIPYVDSVAVGMQSVDEVIMNVKIFEDREADNSIIERVAARKRELHIDFWCEGCGKCVERCTAGALKITGGKAVVNKEECVLCGYCSTACPVFAIKIV